ncbi:hypothetical protein TG4357_03156 [Thalassovita gelatinovora]|uniref:Transmembrane protein (PGPGW) n=1 Tax=Thalassovita gelatinovora TaxID=53501 RepID=A0A0P1FIG9_THAGE|nr:hypothetical protein [Thalassovita gelatinovora]QIZ82125.1 hypothetical protein HFZ77_17395 [Thalassovita gelatinovora]CUH67696.1 hypothetical protein TG4357_03156 [Thalassovita gelatinovora]SEP69201.1 hypothetical protein SAMN04488043_101104 [Thalassovita gelatinovora]
MSSDKSLKLKRRLAQVRNWTRRHIPPGLRLLVGLVLMVAGVFGFLPVIGFWMFPLGVAIAAMDVMPGWRALRRRVRGKNKK